MANKYESFYRDDIERMINDQALKTMLSPVMREITTTQHDETEPIAVTNDRIAQYNDGIRALAMVLVHQLDRMGSEETHE